MQDVKQYLKSNKKQDKFRFEFSDDDKQLRIHCACGFATPWKELGQAGEFSFKCTNTKCKHSKNYYNIKFEREQDPMFR